MSSLPVSVRNKSSKFTLTKKEFYEDINKIGNNAIVIKNNIGINFQSEFSQYKKQVKKNNKNKTQNSNHYSLKVNNNTLDKSKKNFKSINTDFFNLFYQFDLLKKNKTSNKTTIEVSLKEKKSKKIYVPSFSNSKSKGKSNNKKNHNKSKPFKKNSKNKNLKINSNLRYEPLHSNEKNNTISNINNLQRNIILKNYSKNKKFNNDNIKKNYNILKKNFKIFNPFQIKFVKPINTINKNKVKQSNITTYQINYSKLIPNRIHLLHNNINKTQEIQNTAKTIQHSKNNNNINSNKESKNNISINNKNNQLNEKEIINNNNTNILINQNKSFKEKDININQNLDKLLKEELESLEINQNISNIDLFDERENYFNDDDDIESDNSGVLAYDEVRDIIVYYDMGDLKKNQNYLFETDDYKIFLNKKKDKYLNFFCKISENNNNRIIKVNDNKKQTPPTNDTNKTKKTFINEIKNDN